ncbi:MAG: DNA topoisomerase III [Deltaproteobacteria bacterium HGW-Deltaproteobacteria-14]|jgi:DNA topoisomerase-3|nr:MAG: DNA topoisomerase III [Deltaproteobacteria bacterium HGW-Deltaproteobacteria-14]
MVTLVIAEKPSVARDIARVLGATSRQDGYLDGGGYRVSWCVGHLLELQEPQDYDPTWKSWSTKTLPIIPAAFRTRPRKGATKQLGVLRRLARDRDVAHVVNACDAGREGELIFRWVWDNVGPSGRGPRLSRLWISSLTDRAIKDGFAHLRDARDFDRLAAAARCRAQADWLVGLNATRAMTLLGRRGGGREALLSVGRVQTPTLALMTQREDAIDAFVPEPFWKVGARFDLDGDRHFDATWVDGAGKDRLGDAPRAHAIAAAVAGHRGRVDAVKEDRQTRQAPALYDLTTLQKDANRRFGLSAKRTLTAAQALYEQHKALTYPRTDSRFLTADVAAKLPAVLNALRPTPWGPIADAAIRGGPTPTRRIVNPTEVGDHHALLPTGKIPDLAKLGADERRVYELVVRRTLAVFLPAAVFATVTVDVVVPVTGTSAGVGAGDAHRFVAKGTTRLVEGWELAEPPPPKRAAEQSAAQALPVVRQGEVADVGAVNVSEGKTQAPPRYTEATLLAGMEGAGKDLDDDELRRAMRASGLGTPATRAAIIETLLTRHYIERDGKALRPTAQGRLLVASLPVPALTSAELTGRWEAALSELADGRGDAAAFMDRIVRFTTETVQALRTAEAPAMAEAAAADKDASPVLGACPLCHRPVREGRKAYSCESGRDCDFVIFKSIVGKKVSPALVQVLLSRRRSLPLKGFKSKAGKRFAAALVLGDDGKVTLDFGGDAGGARPPRTARATAERGERPKTQRAPAPSARAKAAPSAPADPRPRCPKCKQGHVMAGRRGWGCTRYREGCDMVVWFEQGPLGLRVPDDEAERLFRKKQTRLMAGLIPDVKARLVLDLSAPGNVRVEPAAQRAARSRPS